MPLLQNCPPGFFSLNKWVFICLASSLAGDVKVECQTWRRSPLKRDDCAVSGWMTMAPCAWGSDRLECRRRWGRLQSPELVLCECSSSAEPLAARQQAPLHPTIGTDHWTGARRKNEQRCSSSRRIWCKTRITFGFGQVATFNARPRDNVREYDFIARLLHLCQGSDITCVQISFSSFFDLSPQWYWEEIISTGLRNQGGTQLWSIYVHTSGWFHMRIEGSYLLVQLWSIYVHTSDFFPQWYDQVLKRESV